MTVWLLVGAAGAIAFLGTLFGFVLSNELRLHSRARAAALGPVEIDFTPAAARGELGFDLDWSFPSLTAPRREDATPRSLRC